MHNVYVSFACEVVRVQTGSIEFRNHILKTLPQEGGEQRAQYLQRAARHFKFSTQRLHDLFYDPRTELSVEEHEVLFAQNRAAQSKIELHKMNEALNNQLAVAREKEKQRDEELLRAVRGFREVLDALEKRIAVDSA